MKYFIYAGLEVMREKKNRRFLGCNRKFAMPYAKRYAWFPTITSKSKLAWLCDYRVVEVYYATYDDGPPSSLTLKGIRHEILTIQDYIEEKLKGNICSWREIVDVEKYEKFYPTI